MTRNRSGLTLREVVELREDDEEEEEEEEEEEGADPSDSVICIHSETDLLDPGICVCIWG